jgi:hypothetical protein
MLDALFHTLSVHPFMVKTQQPSFRFTDIFQFMSSLYGPDLHTKRVHPLAAWRGFPPRNWEPCKTP